MNKTTKTIKTIRIAVTLLTICMIPICSIFSMSAYIGSFDHEVHIVVTEDATVTLTENFKDGSLLKLGDDTLSYNTSVTNNGTTGVYVFVEFDSPINNGEALFTPAEAAVEEGAGWILYDAPEDPVTIAGASYQQYVFAYSIGGKMAELGVGGSTGDVFSTITVASMNEAAYKALKNKTFHVVARSVASSSDEGGEISTVWRMVPKDY